MNTFSLKIFTYKLKIAIKRHHLTQNELCELLDISRARYAKYETGKSEPSYSFLCNISELYNISTDDFLNPDITNFPPR